jgi:[NiFe] hydrogenase assembly HybE family chaperone
MPLTPQILVDIYQRIADERMQGMPFVNPALRVEAVDFRPWEDHQVGVLITPWFMNLVLIPGPEDEWRDFGSDKATAWEFPSGSCEFHASRPDGKSLHLCASLFTSVEDFPDQDTARDVGREVMKSLFTPSPDGRSQIDKGDADADALLAKPVSRRGLLRSLTLQED